MYLCVLGYHGVSWGNKTDPCVTRFTDKTVHRHAKLSKDFYKVYNDVSVDTGDPILPVQMPRGYGGTAILWKKQIDHVIKPQDVGGNRIQCVAMNVCEPLLLISVYMPCKGITDDKEEGCILSLEDGRETPRRC